MTVFAGASSSTELNDVWVLNNANGANGQATWTQLTTTGTPPLIREQPASIYDGGTNRMVVFGGLSNPNLLSDLWLLTAADGILPSQLGIVQSIPNHGGNAGAVTVQIIGSGFQNGATVKLIGSGADILGNNTIVLSATVLTATFDLIGATTGVRDLVVTNPDNSSVTLPSAFTVEQGGSPNVSVDIIGRSQIRFGRPQSYYLVVSNTGNVDGSPDLVTLSFPSTISADPASGSDLFFAGSTLDPAFGIPLPGHDTDTNLVFATAGVPASATQVVPILLTLPASVSGFTMMAADPVLSSISFETYAGSQGVPVIKNFSCKQCNIAGTANIYFNSQIAASDAFDKYQRDLAGAQRNAALILADIGLTVAKALAVRAAVALPPEQVAALGLVISAGGAINIKSFFNPTYDIDAALRDFSNKSVAAAIGLAGNKNFTTVAAFIPVVNLTANAIAAAISFDLAALTLKADRDNFDACRSPKPCAGLCTQ
jgi:hypothetical protein